MTDKNYTVGQRIKMAREAKRISAETLSRKLDISKSTLYRYENGEIEKVSPDIVKQIGRALGVSPAYLMGWDKITTNIVHGDNHGVNGLDTGNGNMNTFNFNNNTEKQDKHNDNMRNIGVADLKMQRSLLNKLDKQITLMEENNILLTTLIETQEELLKKIGNK